MSHLNNFWNSVLTVMVLLIMMQPALSLESAERQNIINKAEDYLDKLDSVEARFIQTAHDGTQLVGNFYLDRPGKLRFDYDPPLEDFVVADGFFIYFYDAELGEQTNAPIGQTLADFILRENIELSGDITVQNIRKSGGFLQFTITQTEDPQAGTLMLAFSENPFALKKWRVIDAQGLITEVELFNIKKGVEHPRGLFVYRDPKARRTLNN